MDDEISQSGAEHYEGFDAHVQEQIQQLAKSLTSQSQLSFAREPNGIDEESNRSSRVSTIAPGVNPMVENFEKLDPRLDPSNSNFQSRYWIKNLKALMDKDPNHYKTYALGVTSKNLRASGVATDADYQSTVLNAPLKLVHRYAKELFSSKEAKKSHNSIS
jgi:ATP-binding cassette subfamily G (WHITE) protein 2 (PDR)